MVHIHLSSAFMAAPLQGLTCEFQPTQNKLMQKIEMVNYHQILKEEENFSSWRVLQRFGLDVTTSFSSELHCISTKILMVGAITLCMHAV